MAESRHALEVRAGERYTFGANWSRFLGHLTPERIENATASLRTMLQRESLAGLTFLDAGSGSGLFSLAARRLGARVHSFDFDPQSVACTAELRSRYAPGDPQWRVESGSVLDRDYLASLGTYDIVYSWGVLHHTGRQQHALENVVPLVKPGGTLFIALYNDQGWISTYWTAVKRHYNKHPLLRAPLVALHVPYLLGARFVARALTGRLTQERGMSLWYDLLDWLGGWPFEVSTPSDIVGFYQRHGFTPVRVDTVGRRPGCNEFVFTRGLAS